MIKIFIKTLFLSFAICSHIFAGEMNEPTRDLIELKALLLSEKFGDFYGLNQSLAQGKTSWAELAGELQAKESKLTQKLSETPFFKWFRQNLNDYSDQNENILADLYKLVQNMPLWQIVYADVRDSLIRCDGPNEKIASLIKTLLRDITSFIKKIGNEEGKR